MLLMQRQRGLGYCCAVSSSASLKGKLRAAAGINRTCRISALCSLFISFFYLFQFFWLCFFSLCPLLFCCAMQSLNNRKRHFLSFLLCFFWGGEYFRGWKIKSSACRHNQHHLTPVQNISYLTFTLK